MLATLACGGPDPVEMPAPPPPPFVSTAQLEQAAARLAAAQQAAADQAPLLLASADQVDAALEQPVRVVGTAQDAKLSAAVVGDDLLVYCMTRGEGDVLSEYRWPEDTLGQQVAVTGTLEQSEQFIATVAPDGAISQGTEGPILAMVDCAVELIPVAVPEPAPAP